MTHINGEPVRVWVTCYGCGDGYTHASVTAYGATVGEELTFAVSVVGCDGICAVGAHTPWWRRVKSEDQAIICIPDGDAAGRYLACDVDDQPDGVDVWNEGPGAWSYRTTAEECEEKQVDE